MTPPAAAGAIDPRVPRSRPHHGSVRHLRRVSGPVVRPRESPRGIALLDRVLRGRLWIALLAFALIGIVAMQLVVLELNTHIGRTLQREALLQRENSQLGIENSVYTAESRIAPLATAAGMTFAAPGAVHFVSAAAGDYARAAEVLAGAAQAQASAQASTGSSEATASPEVTGSSETTPAGEQSGSTGGEAQGANAGSAEPAAGETQASEAG